MSKLYYNIEQASRKLGESVQKIEARIRDGELQTVSVGNRNLILARSIDNLLKQKTFGSPRSATPQETSMPRSSRTLGKLSNTEKKYSGFGDQFYTPRQVADILDTDLFEVDKLVRRGILPVASINKHRWISVKAVEDLVEREYGLDKLANAPEPHQIKNLQVNKAKTQNKDEEIEKVKSSDSSTQKEATFESVEDHYTIQEVARKLNKPSHEIWRIAFFEQLPVDIVEGKRVFPKKAIEDFLANRKRRMPDDNHQVNPPNTESPATGAEIGQEFQGANIEEAVIAASTALGVSNEEIAYEVIDPGSKGFLGTNKVDARIKLTNIAPFSKNAASKIELSSNEDAGRSEGDHAVILVSEREIMKAAQKLGTSINKVRQMVAEKKLVLDPETGQLGKPASPTDDETSSANKSESAAEKHRSQIREAAERLAIATSQVRKKIVKGELVSDPTTGRWVLSNRSSTRSSDSGVEADVQSEPDIQKIRELEEWVKDLQEELRNEREEKKLLTKNLEQEREEHQQDVQDAQYEIDRVDAELANLRRGSNNSILGSRLKQERELRDEAERWARELESQLDGEMVLKSERERWFADLESKLSEAETKRRELEDTLSFEREKVHELEGEQRILNDVRRLLGSGSELPRSPLEKSAGEIAPSSHATSYESQTDNLPIETRYGKWNFHPPFTLTREEVELIQLVAGADGITAEQIKSRKTRRSVEKLNDLLDRLLEAGIEPIKEDSDRYFVDPDFM